MKKTGIIISLIIVLIILIIFFAVIDGMKKPVDSCNYKTSDNKFEFRSTAMNLKKCNEIANNFACSHQWISDDGKSCFGLECSEYEFERYNWSK